jgi:hypothetical protein
MSTPRGKAVAGILRASRGNRDRTPSNVRCRIPESENVAGFRLFDRAERESLHDEALAEKLKCQSGQRREQWRRSLER